MNDEINKFLLKFWDQGEIPITKSLSGEEQIYEQHFVEISKCDFVISIERI